ncbi:MAG: hypothetical protein LLF94_09050 [Chlamydiales bacterium]|nr:hypothetical protein [Chlamydiales bacterium]
MYNTKNYTEQGGEKTVIGGTLEIATGASVTGITTATIVDNLTSTDADKALSAKQGKTLKDLADAKIATAAIVNNLIAGGVAVPLSAEQGKTLGARVAANQAASVEAVTPTVAEFNALLAKLKAAGLMVAD